jgi:crotonobetainyl-CoA:carnitine CoA-transferase CaiB-like acyl-CoA transferase
MVAESPIDTRAPLHGVRILDLTRVLAGPWASQLLADYGADVVKVERPGTGDDTRAWGPPWLEDQAGDATSDSAYFLSANRNKRSLTVDVSTDRGQALIRSLAAESDVVMENFRVGTMAKFGLDYTTLAADHPALIMCSISAYGQSGTRAARPGYDAMIQASGGLMSVTGASDEEGGGPVKVGVAIADIMAGMYATSAILAALVSRQASGHGQHIDVPLYDTQVAWLANQAMNFLVGGECPGRLGTAHPNLVPYQAFPTRDGHLMLAVGNDRQFSRLVECLGLPDVANDARFSNNAVRVANRAALVSVMSDAFGQRDTADWLVSLEAAGVPAGPINSVEDIFTEDYATERALVQTMPHATAGQVPGVANPVHFSATPVAYRHAPPALGEHTRDILRQELGMSDADIDQLAADGVI